jgi:urease accessory protein
MAGPFLNWGFRMFLRRIAAPLILLASASPALAHTGHGASGFVHGFSHPIGGLDHVLAMVAIGLYAAMLGGRALWLVPAAFLGAMAIGGALGMISYGLPYTETGIAVSVIVLGLAVAFRISLPTLAAMALAGLFAIFHGHAHGAEMPQTVSGYEYAAGFLLATALLHATGIAVGLIAGRLTQRGGWRVAQAAGGAMALTGAVLLAAAL